MESTLLSIDKAISDCFMNITNFEPRTNIRMIGALFHQSTRYLCLDASFGRMFCGNMSHIMTGSVAELTMKTPLPCFGDSDFMMRLKSAIVMPFGTPFPKKECLRKYKYKEMELWSYRQTEFPAYVRLCFAEYVSFDKETGSVHFVPYTHSLSEGERYFDWHFHVPVTVKDHPVFAHGPAFAFQDDNFSSTIKSYKSIDLVPCIFCPHWPPEARDFYERKRPHGWPTRSTIEEIVSLGCYLVQVSHPLYKEQVVKPQWRFSFSIAEIILIRTWSNSQKIVYHLLRYLNKNTELFEDHVICTYHLKTLMLWNCEKRPPEYWNSQRLMHIVADLLSELKQCVQAKRLQSYFISDCNLVFNSREQPGDYNRENADATKYSPDQLSLLKVEDLGDWFLRNYLFFVAQKYPENEFGKMAFDFQRNKINTMINDIDWIQTFTQVLLNDFAFTENLSYDLEFSINVISVLYNHLKMHQRSFLYVLGMLQQADARLINFFRAHILLNAAQEIEKSKQLPNRWLIGIILDVVNDFKDGDNYIWEFTTYDDQCDTAESCFNMALFILRMMADRKESVANVLLLELAKCCFRKSLQYSDTLAISSSAVVYLAMISCKQRLYEEAIDLCVLVIECPYVREMHGINRDLLKAIELQYLLAFSGFAELLFNYSTERNSTLKTDANEYPPGIVAVMLLKDILDRCGSNVSKYEHLEAKLTTQLGNHNCKRHTNENLKPSKQNSENEYISPLTLRIVLQYVKKLSGLERKSKQKIVIYSRRSVTQLPKITDGLFDSLLDLSVRYLTAFQKSVMEDLEPLKYCVITDQYMMLHYFRCGDYVSALEISDQVIASYVQNQNKPIMTYSIYHTIVSPPFHLLLDDQLKMFIDKTKPLGVLRFIDTEVVALYTKSECLLKLDKPVFYFYRQLITLRHWAESEAAEKFLLSAEIARYQLEKLLHVFSDRVRLLPSGKFKCKLQELQLSEVLDTPDIAAALNIDDLIYCD